MNRRLSVNEKTDTEYDMKQYQLAAMVVKQYPTTNGHKTNNKWIPSYTYTMIFYIWT